MGKYHLLVFTKSVIIWEVKVSFNIIILNQFAFTTFFKVALNYSFLSLKKTWLVVQLLYLPLLYAIASSFVLFKNDQGFVQTIYRHPRAKLKIIQS